MPYVKKPKKPNTPYRPPKYPNCLYCQKPLVFKQHRGNKPFCDFKNCELQYMLDHYRQRHIKPKDLVLELRD
jgi:hypothetical protein